MNNVIQFPHTEIFLAKQNQTFIKKNPAHAEVNIADTVMKALSRFSMLKAAFNRVLYVNPANLFVSVSLHVSDSDKPVEHLPVILGVTIPCKLCYPDPVIL